MSTPESTPGEVSRLIARLSDGTLTTQEAERLNQLLRADAAAQEAYLDHMALDGLLEQEFGSAAFALPDARGEITARKVIRGPWRGTGGWGAMVAGLVLGAFLTSAVWAYAFPRTGVVKSRPLPLVDGDFEETEAPETNGVPTRAGRWSGDLVTVTGRDAGVAPHSGAHMLRFLRADNAQATHDTPVRAGELWQVMDLRPLRSTLGEGTVTLQVSGWFNAAPHPARRYTCGVALVACRGEAAEAPALWKVRHEVALAEADREERLDGDAHTWQRVETQLTVPPDAELLLVQVRIYDKTARPEEGASTFPAHYADNIELRLIEGPTGRLVTRTE